MPPWPTTSFPWTKLNGQVWESDWTSLSIGRRIGETYLRILPNRDQSLTGTHRILFPWPLTMRGKDNWYVGGWGDITPREVNATWEKEVWVRGNVERMIIAPIIQGLKDWDNTYKIFSTALKHMALIFPAPQMRKLSVLVRVLETEPMIYKKRFIESNWLTW